MNDSGRMGMDKRKYFLLKTVIFLFMFVASYTHDLYEAEATQIEDKFTEVQQLI